MSGVPDSTEKSSLASGDRTRPVVSSLKDRIAKFNDLSAGSAPLVPLAPFGLGAPPPHARSQAKGGLIGNRIPSMDPKTAGILPGAATAYRKPSEGAARPASRIPSVSAAASSLSASERPDSPAGSVGSSATSGGPGAVTHSPPTSRSASPVTTPDTAVLPPHLLTSTLPGSGEGTATPSSTHAEASLSTTSLLLPSQGSSPDSLSKQNLQLNAGSEGQAMSRQNSGASVQAPIATPSISSVQTQYDPSSTGSGEVTKMMQDVSGVSTPMGTPRAARRELGTEGDSVQGEGSVMDDVDTAEQDPGSTQGSDDVQKGATRLHQEDIVFNPTADIEDVVTSSMHAPVSTASETISLEEGDNVQGPDGVNIETKAPSLQLVAQAGEDVVASSVTPDTSPDVVSSLEAAERLPSDDTAETPRSTTIEDDPNNAADLGQLKDATIYPPSLPQGLDQNAADRLANVALKLDPSMHLPGREEAPTDHSQDASMTHPLQADEVQIPGDDLTEPEHPTTSAKPRARLGPTEVVYLPNSDSDDEDEVDDGDADEDGGIREEGDFLSEHPDDTEDLHLRHMRLTTEALAPLRLSRFGEHLLRLCLRQNTLTSPIPSATFERLVKLEELDMYDNRLGPEFTNAEVKGCPNIKTLDLSFNNIRHAPNLPDLSQVETLYLVQNKISTIEAGDLDWCKETMRSLELGGNRLRRIENLETLTRLEELWLGKNKIRVLENLDTFSNLKILSMQSNRITRISGLEGLVNLEELYFSHNGLTKIEGLENNLKLRTLDVGNNEITEIENVSHLLELEEFWASYNRIPNLQALDRELGGLPALETVYLEGNPCQKNDMAGYRRKVMLALPNIKQIDATYVQAIPYTVKTHTPVEQSTMGNAGNTKTSAETAEAGAGAQAPSTSFPDAATGTPTESLSIDPAGLAPSTPLDPTFLTAFPSVPALGDAPDSSKVRVEVIVPPSGDVKQSSTVTQQFASQQLPSPEAGPLGTTSALSPDGQSDDTEQKLHPKSPLLDDEDPGDFEEGWAVVTKGRAE